MHVLMQGRGPRESIRGADRGLLRPRWKERLTQPAGRRGQAPKEVDDELGILQWVVVRAVKGLLWARGGKRERRHLRSAEGPGEEGRGKLTGARADSARGLWRHHVYNLVFCLLPFKVTQLHTFCPSTALQSH